MAPHEPTSPRRRIVCRDEWFENYDAVSSRDVSLEGDAAGCSEGTVREREGRLSPTRIRGIVGEPARVSAPLASRQLNTALRPVVAPSRAAFT